MLSTSDKANLIRIARTSLETFIRKGKIHSVEPGDYSENLRLRCGAFVSLHKNGKLRGCTGRLRTEDPLCKLVRDMAISASTKDYRFRAVNSSELGEIDLELSVLTPPVRLNDPSDIVLGKHGIYLKLGDNTGTFLPQVAEQTGWNVEEFLGHCARDKAGIGWYGWKNAELYTYEAIVFSEDQY